MDDINNEIWIQVTDYDDYYISSLGRVKSIKYNKDRYLKPSDNGKGYKNIILYKNSVGKSHYIHRLVALAFLQNDLNLSEVNHIDGDKSNNKLSNLEWLSSSDNKKHAFKIGLMSNTLEAMKHNVKIATAATALLPRTDKQLKSCSDNAKRMNKLRLNVHIGAENVCSKRVKNTYTNVIYSCIREAAEAEGHVYSTLKSRLNGGLKNNTNLIIMD